MISIEAYRVAIGIYVFTARFLSQLEPRKRCNSPHNIDFALFKDSNVYFLSLVLLFEIILSLYLSFLYAFAAWSYADDFMVDFYATRMIFTAVPSLTALSTLFVPKEDRGNTIWPIQLHLCAMTVNFIAYLIQFSELQRSFYEGVGGGGADGDDDDDYDPDYNESLGIGPPLNYIVTFGFWLFSFYPNLCYLIECYRGYWNTAEDFARESLGSNIVCLVCAGLVGVICFPLFLTLLQ